MHAVLNLIISRDKKLIGPINVTFTDAHVMKFNILYLNSCLHVSKVQRKKAKTVEKEMAVIGHKTDLLA